MKRKEEDERKTKLQKLCSQTEDKDEDMVKEEEGNVMGSRGDDVWMIQGDSEVVAGWVNGTCAVKGADTKKLVGKLQRIQYELWKNRKAVLPEGQFDWIQHVFREDNKEADEMANKAMDGEEVREWQMWERNEEGGNVFWGTFDGGKRGGNDSDGPAGAGWVIKVWQPEDRSTESNCKRRRRKVDLGGGGVWKVIHRGALKLPNHANSMGSELKACEMLTRAIVQVSSPMANCFSVHLGGLFEIIRVDCDCVTLCQGSRKK